MLDSEAVSRKSFLTSVCKAVPLAAGVLTGSTLCEPTPLKDKESELVKSAWSPNMKAFGAIGKGEPALDGHREAVLLDHSGHGCLTHMWFGGAWPGYEKTRIRVFIDGETEPSIDMELGLGHGFGFGDGGAPWGTAKMGKTGDPSGMYNTLRVPFGRHIRVTGQRHAEGPAQSPFWWILRGTENLPVLVGGVELPSAARLRLHKLESFVAKPLQEFALFDVNGSGALYQVTIAAKAVEHKEGWFAISYLEGCMRAYIGKSAEPLMLSSGLEDYFTGTYYFNRGRFANELAGLTHFDEKAQSFSAYRFHDDDPLFFDKGLRLTCRCGDTESGAISGHPMGDPPETVYDTYAWVYQW